MPPGTKNYDVDKLSGLRKAAILVVALPEEAAEALLKPLPVDLVEALAREIAVLDEVPQEVRTAVVKEFYYTALARQYAARGGLSTAKALLQRTLPPEEAKKIISSIEHQVHQQPFSFLQKTETENLRTFLASEHPQTIALVLSHLPPAMASEILVGLEADKQVEVVMRIANMEQTRPEVIASVERGLQQSLSGLMSEQFERAGGIQAVAEILNLAGRAAEKQILEGLASESPDLVEEIRRRMFVFEDIIRLDDRGIQAMLKEVQNDELALALKTASEDLKQKIFSNMSERAATLIKEEMEFMGPVRVSDVEAAQQKIVEIVRKLEESGEIVIPGKGGEKELIV